MVLRNQNIRSVSPKQATRILPGDKAPCFRLKRNQPVEGIPVLTQKHHPVQMGTFASFSVLAFAYDQRLLFSACSLGSCFLPQDSPSNAHAIPPFPIMTTRKGPGHGPTGGPFTAFPGRVKTTLLPLGRSATRHSMNLVARSVEHLMRPDRTRYPEANPCSFKLSTQNQCTLSVLLLEVAMRFVMNNGRHTNGHL